MANDLIPTTARTMQGGVIRTLNGLPIWDLKDGEKVSKPGLYRCSSNWYHSQCCIGPSVSSTGLRTIFMKSPAHFWQTSSLNPRYEDARTADEKEALLVGRAAHHILLGQENFERHFVIRPSIFDNWLTKKAKEWRKEMWDEGFDVLEPKHIIQIAGMRRGLANDPLVQQGILNGAIELSMFWLDEETGLWLKARPDAIPNEDGDYGDLKTTVSVDDDAIRRTIGERGYFMQGALTGEGHKALFKTEMQSFTLAFVEKKEPFCAATSTIPEADLDLGHEANRAAMRMLKRCMEAGRWPGPGGMTSDAQYRHILPFQRMKFENRLSAMKQEMQIDD
jgi:hypothetical protein